MTIMDHRVGHCVGTGFIALDIIRSALDEHLVIERRHVGGSCGNVLAILSFLGMQSTAVGRIGVDSAGDELIEDLQRLSVGTQFLVMEPGRRTPALFQESFIDAQGRARHRFSRVCPVCGETMPGYRPLLVRDVSQIADTLPTHHSFFFDRVSPGTLHLARRSRAQGALIFFEPSGIKDERLFLQCLQVSHVLKYSNDRLRNLDSFTVQAKIPLEIETLGEKGLRFRTHSASRHQDWRYMPAVPVSSLRDSVGSGDWCTAGFLFKLMTSDQHHEDFLNDVQQISKGLAFGQALASINCAFEGARGLMNAMSQKSALKKAELSLNRSPTMIPEERQLRGDRMHDNGANSIPAHV